MSTANKDILIEYLLQEQLLFGIPKSSLMDDRMDRHFWLTCASDEDLSERGIVTIQSLHEYKTWVQERKGEFCFNFRGKFLGIELIKRPSTLMIQEAVRNGDLGEPLMISNSDAVYLIYSLDQEKISNQFNRPSHNSLMQIEGHCAADFVLGMSGSIVNRRVKIFSGFQLDCVPIWVKDPKQISLGSLHDFWVPMEIGIKKGKLRKSYPLVLKDVPYARSHRKEQLSEWFNYLVWFQRQDPTFKHDPKDVIFFMAQNLCKPPYKRIEQLYSSILYRNHNWREELVTKRNVEKLPEKGNFLIDEWIQLLEGTRNLLDSTEYKKLELQDCINQIDQRVQTLSLLLQEINKHSEALENINGKN